MAAGLLVFLGTCLLLAMVPGPGAVVILRQAVRNRRGADLPIKLSMVALAVLWTMVDGLWFAVVVWLIGRAAAVFSRTAIRRRLAQVSGSVLIVLGVRLALESR